MKRVLLVGLVLVMAGMLAYAGEAPQDQPPPPPPAAAAVGPGQQPGPPMGPGNRRFGPGMMPGGPGMRMPFDSQPVYVPRSKALNAARRFFDLTDEQRKAVEKLETDREQEARKAIETMLEELDKKYADLAGQAMTPENKAKYEKVLAAEAERDKAIKEADAEVRATIDTVRTEQAVDLVANPVRFLPRNKEQMITMCLKLTDEQRKQVDDLRRNRDTEMQNTMRALQPKDWKDEKARREYMEKSQTARKQIEGESAEAMILVLNDPQKKALETVSTAMDAYDKKVQQANETCDKKLTELVPKEKLDAARQMDNARPGGMPGRANGRRFRGE